MKKLFKIISSLVVLSLIFALLSSCKNIADNTKQNESKDIKTENAIKSDEDLIKETIETFFNSIWHDRDFSKAKSCTLEGTDLYSMMNKMESSYAEYIANGGDPNANIGMDIMNMDTVKVHEITINENNATANIEILGAGAKASTDADGNVSEVEHSESYTDGVVTLEKQGSSWFLLTVGE